jgi:hypothetical protein
MPHLCLTLLPVDETQSTADAPATALPDRPAAAPAVLSLQPQPICTIYTHLQCGGEWTTNITRVFRPADVPHCRLCTVCSAHRETGACLNSFREFVPYDQIPMKLAPQPAATAG